MNYGKILFDYIHQYGEVFGRGPEESLCTIDNTGPKANGQVFYRCFVKGGIQFEISKERAEWRVTRVLPFLSIVERLINQWTYVFIPVWEGPFNCSDAESAVSVLRMLGHEL
jgi:hypothetical protein